MELKLYKGVVEENNDPDKLQRVQVRILGIHSKNNENSSEEFAQVKTADLPWAEVMGSTGFGLVGGIGLSSVLRKGTWVWVGLEMGDPNKPVIMGTCTGINSESPVGKAAGGDGFYDPDEKIPPEARSAETDVNRLARGEKLGDDYYDESPTTAGANSTHHQQINDNLCADIGEPNSTSDASVYPDNQVIETQSGHVIEFDDTPGNERIRMIHRTGSYFEIKPDGTFVQKSVDTAGENFYIHMSAVKQYIEKELTAIFKGAIDVDAQGDLILKIGGALTVEATGEVTVKGSKINLN